MRGNTNGAKMSWITIDACQCDREGCGHIWLPRGAEAPTRCAKCKSANWDQGGISNEMAKGLQEAAIETNETIKTAIANCAFSPPKGKTESTSDRSEIWAEYNTKIEEIENLEGVVCPPSEKPEGWQPWMSEIPPRALGKFQVVRKRLPLNEVEWVTYLKRGY